MQENQFKIGIDVGGTTIKAILMQGDDIIDRVQKDTPSNINDFSLTIKSIIDNFSVGKEITNVGIAMPGMVDYKKQTVIFCPNIKYLENINAVDMNLPIKAKIANDADCALMFEMSQIPTTQQTAILTLGTGVGGAFSLNGIPPTEFNLSGEIGHTKIDSSEAVCSCGQYGCIEAIASAKAMVGKARDTIDPEIKSVEEIFDLYRQNNDQARTIINDMSNALGLTIANLVNILGCETIILGGKISLSFDLFYDMVFSKSKENIHLLEKRNFNIIKATDPEFGGCRGATLL